MMPILLVALSCYLANNAWAAVLTSTVQQERGRDARSHVELERQADVGRRDKVISVELYYETRCPDCTGFLSETLAPIWQDMSLRATLNLTMYPFGNAEAIPVSTISKGYKFWHPKSTGEGFTNVAICQHGTDECFGNLIQACAINMVSQEKSMALIFCMASHPEYSIEKASYECMQKHDIDPKKIKDCVQSPKGNELITTLAKQTESVPGRDWTPWIMIDGQHLKNQTHFVPTICTKVSELLAEVGGDTPSTCQHYAHAPGSQDPDFTVLSKVKNATVKDLMSRIPKEI